MIGNERFDMFETTMREGRDCRQMCTLDPYSPTILKNIFRLFFQDWQIGM